MGGISNIISYSGAMIGGNTVMKFSRNVSSSTLSPL